jgi:hypothetical protein
MKKETKKERKKEGKIFPHAIDTHFVSRDLSESHHDIHSNAANILQIYLQMSY